MSQTRSGKFDDVIKKYSKKIDDVIKKIFKKINDVIVYF